MVLTWQPSPSELTPFGLSTVSWTQPDGTLTLAAARLVDAGGGHFARYTLIADADGPVRQALFESAPTTCASIIEAIQDGMAVYHVYENNSDFAGGAFGGAIDAASPERVLHFSDHVAHEFVAGIPGLIDDATMYLYPWQASSRPATRITDPSDQGLPYSFLAFSGQTLFWQAQSLAIQKEKVWTAASGARDFIAFGSDSSQGAADLGTDGKDIVWLQGSGRTNPSGYFPTVSIQTSPFASDPAGLRPRRLRSEKGENMGVEPFTVGCGYAALALSDGIRLVRLVDGVSWHLSSVGAWQWVNPVALTCTELFAKVQIHHDGAPGMSEFARVALDSLGPGTAPD